MAPPVVLAVDEVKRSSAYSRGSSPSGTPMTIASNVSWNLAGRSMPPRWWLEVSKTAQVRLGHSDPRMTLAIYASAPASADRAAADVLGAAFFGNSSER